MNVSRQSTELVEEAERGPRARTRRLMLETATRLMQAGVTPSVSEVAEAAEVSRATAYRYFPSQAALVEAVVDEALGPILAWQSGSTDPQARVADLFGTSLPRIDAFEATFRAALKLALDEWAQRKAGAAPSEPPFRRGHRVDLLREALVPLRGSLPAAKVERLAQALSLIFGVEALVVLKDMWGLDAGSTEDVVRWAAAALVRAAIEEG
ncbi:TetR/AcrR family transcriptional regulator [Mesorhizobium sp. J428]|uniref:TetR/AcrR family transcriptional regulator n=1 Tax=Mesorhizobium sp. J428 TaxID=2898440 RepID=UPI0021510385|nr:TetR/AcrR family transcriptional regulator [Mesorhizobium sp. J428]MCR5856660.1 TetR/AcrR family transcriptional regulator [Mesorhizobium sp. J428]